MWVRGFQLLHRRDVAWKIRPVARGFGGGGGTRTADKLPVQTHYENARKLFANSILSRVTTSLSTGLRERTTRQLLYGNSTPFFAFVGIGLASGSILRKEDQLEGLCWEIRESLERMQKSMAEAESDLFRPSEPVGINKFTIGPFIGKGSNAAIFAARKKPMCEATDDCPSYSKDEPLSSFPFALKMVFNYGINSNVSEIMTKTFKEMMPARVRYSPPEAEDLLSEGIHLPPHPNLVTMHVAFPDRVPDDLPNATEFSNALPSRLTSVGYGRNMSLFILMKRYEMNLSEYLSKEKVETREAILIFAQILEAIAHINRHGVAHRDLKSDNFLVDVIHEKEHECPCIVLTDFGCCLADPINGLFLPFLTPTVDKGGNSALMAPEVASAKLNSPGVSILSPIKYIDYTKSDGWAAGAIAYELFTGENPFCKAESLRNTTYVESQLPPLDEVPSIIRKVVKSLLVKSQAKRISADFAADVVQLYLWAPSNWLKKSVDISLPSNTEIMQWLLCMTTKILTTASFGQRRSQAEYLLIGSFLRRACLSRLRSAIAFAQAD